MDSRFEKIEARVEQLQLDNKLLKERVKHDDVESRFMDLENSVQQLERENEWHQDYMEVQNAGIFDGKDTHEMLPFMRGHTKLGYMLLGVLGFCVGAPVALAVMVIFFKAAMYVIGAIVSFVF